MFQKLLTRRRGVAIATVALGLSGMSMVFAGTAGATGFEVLPGGGSNTAYVVMTNISTIFNQSPGCDLAGTSKPVNGTCALPYAAGGAGENGITAAKENPYNDASVELPAVGSGTGVKELYTAGSTFEAYARSSGTPANTKATSGQNYEEYAIDGVPFVHFTKHGATLLANHSATSISLTQLEQIYNDTFQCTIGATVYHMNWACLGSTVSPTASLAHIDCYMAQAGSGTEATWKAAMAGGTGGVDNPPCANDEEFGHGGSVVNHSIPAQVAAANASHVGLFENEVSSIVTPGTTVTEPWYNGDEASALYYFSFGKFSTQCPGIAGSATTDASGVCAGAAGWTVSTGAISNGGPPIHAYKTSIQGTGGGVPGNFPIIRYLSNVYNNTSSGTNGIADQSTLNLVSEYGFVCKPGTHTDMDPFNPGVNYRTEIEAAITGAGFFPVDTSAASPFSEGSQTTAASITDANFKTVDPTYTSTNPSGYCLSVHL
jgi:hypothetical protein